MGTWNFTIDIKIEVEDAEFLLKVYKDNKLFQSAFCFAIFDENIINEFNAGISSVIDDFLPANHLIYRFLSSLKNPNGNFYIKTRKVIRIFDFEKKSDFVNFMYNIWEERIDYAYKQIGVVLIENTGYYKIRKKLYKKYYKKF